ncbi:putative palmitoyltransferase ZDHHC21, partial [Camelus dromedarius]
DHLPLWVGRQSEDCKMGLRIHFVVDPHGWCCMGLIVFVWLYNFFLIPKIILFPHYEEGHIPGVLIISVVLLYPSNKMLITFSFKRINNCVGEDNHWLFLQLCFYTELLACYGLMFSFCHYYYFLPLKKRNVVRNVHIH